MRTGWGKVNESVIIVSTGGTGEMDGVQRLVLKMVVLGRWQLETAVALLQVTTQCFEAVLGAGVGERWSQGDRIT